jgi:flagellar biosynthetic protein FlhB
MPEQTAGEKVFPASQHKRIEARKKGSVARSTDLTGALVFLALIIAIRAGFSGGNLPSLLQSEVQQAFAFNPRPFGFGMETFVYWQLQAVLWASHTLLPVLLIALAVGLVSNIAQVGLVISLEAAAPDWSRVNPAKGFERMFSLRGTAELLKSISKILMIGFICWAQVNGNLDKIIESGDLPLPFFLSVIGGIVWAIAIRVAVLLAILAGVDYAFQRAQFEKMMRMSREDLRQEQKQQDGDPLMKRRMRQKQKEMAKNRMMHAVPKADVVITNPTHFAIALMYDAKTMKAPKVVAKGQDEIAQQIKRIAQESSVPLVENVPLARALFHSVKLGKEVPSNLFRAVAEVLAFVYRTYGRRNN